MNELQFKEDIKLKYNNKYNLSNIWFRTMYYKICIKCPIHGDFIITPDMLYNRRGCPICKDKPLKLKTKEPFIINSVDIENCIADEDKSLIYCIKLVHRETNETFIKVGKANNLKTRFSVLHFDVTPLVLHQVDRNEALRIEKDLHILLKEYKYKPKVNFCGKTECYLLDKCIGKKVFNYLVL